MRTTRTFLSTATACALVAWTALAPLPGPWGTSEARAQSLRDALAAAYMNNPDLQARRAELRATDQGVSQAKGGWRPTVTVTGQAGWQRFQQDMGGVSADPVTTTPASVGISVTQPLFRGFRTRAQVDAAEQSVYAGRANLLSSEQQILLDAATAYLNVVRDAAVVDLNRNNEDVLSRQLEATRDRFRVGEITRTDVAQAEARLSGASADTAAAMADLENSRANFTRIVGAVPNGLAAPDMVPTLPESLDQTINMALASNPAVLAADHVWQAAQDQINNQRGRLLPTVDLTGSYRHNWEAGNQEDASSDTLSAQINVTVPIYQGGTVYGGLREAKHTAGQRRLELDGARNQVREQAQQAWENMRATKSRIAALEDQIEAAEIALEGVQREAQVGARTVLDVLDAEQELLNARVDLVRTQRNEVVAAFNVLAAVGGMTARGLDLPVPIHDPTQNYDAVKDQWFGSSVAADADAALGRDGSTPPN